MAWKKRQGEREVRVREDGKGFDENVGDSLVTGEMWIELVPIIPTVSITERKKVECSSGVKVLSDRANNETSTGGVIQAPVPRVIGNVVVCCSSYKGNQSSGQIDREKHTASGVQDSHSCHTSGSRTAA